MHTIICAISKILELQRGTFFGNNLAMLHTYANNLQAWADALAVTQTTYQNAEKLKAQTSIIIVTVLPFWIHHLIHLHTHTFNGPFSGTTQDSWYQKGKTNLDFTEAKDSAWQ